MSWPGCLQSLQENFWGYFDWFICHYHFLLSTVWLGREHSRSENQMRKISLHCLMSVFIHLPCFCFLYWKWIEKIKSCCFLACAVVTVKLLTEWGRAYSWNCFLFPFQKVTADLLDYMILKSRLRSCIELGTNMSCWNQKDISTNNSVNVRDTVWLSCW